MPLRKRYLALRAESSQPLTERDLMSAIWTTLYQVYGEFGASQAALSMVEYDNERRILIIRCSHTALDMIRSTIAAVTQISREPTVFRVIRVSGTLKALKKKLPKC